MGILIGENRRQGKREREDFFRITYSKKRKMNYIFPLYKNKLTYI